MPKRLRDTTAYDFDPETFYQLLNQAREKAQHSWIDVASETGVGVDVFRRLRGPRRPNQPEGACPRLPQYLSMTAYIHRHKPSTSTYWDLPGAVGKLYPNEKKDAE